MRQRAWRLPDSSKGWPALRVLHLQDAQFPQRTGGYLDTGTINFPEFFGALASIEYRGVITFESFSCAVVDDNLSNALSVWRNLWSNGMDLAKHARQFMTDGVTHASKS